MTILQNELNMKKMFKVRRQLTEFPISTIFWKMFNTDIRKYIDLTGFDVIKFDVEFLKTPDDISTSDYLEQKYSKEHKEFIEGLLTL